MTSSDILLILRLQRGRERERDRERERQTDEQTDSVSVGIVVLFMPTLNSFGHVGVVIYALPWQS